MDKKVSVIIAAYNEEKYIKGAIRTLYNQTFPPYEVIVVDDGSYDATWEILKKLRPKYNNLKIFRQKHVEQAPARNFGVKKSNGDILVFPDADYLYDKRFIEKLVNPIIAGKSLATFPGQEYVANKNNPWSILWNINFSLPLGRRIPNNFVTRGDNFRAIKRSVFEKSGGYEEKGYVSDVTVLRKIGLSGEARKVQDAISYHYNPDSPYKVFQAGRRMGAKSGAEFSPKSFLIFSPFNSLRKGIIKAIKERSPLFVVFKIIFDTGVLFGLFERLNNGR